MGVIMSSITAEQNRVYKNQLQFQIRALKNENKKINDQTKREKKDHPSIQLSIHSSLRPIF